MLDGLGDGGPEVIDGAGGGLSEQGLEFSDGLLDGIEVGRVRRQEQARGASRLDCLFHAGDLVGRQVVHHDQIARHQGGHEDLLHSGEEGGPVHWPVQEHGGGEAIQAQTGGEGGCLPMSMRDRGTAAFATL